MIRIQKWGDDMAKKRRTTIDKAEESAVQRLHRLTDEVTPSESETLGRVIKVLESIGISCMTDDAKPLTAGFEVSDPVGNACAELKVAGKNLDVHITYPFDIPYNMVAVVGILMARLNYEAEDAFFKLDIHCGEISLDGRYHVDGELDEEEFLKWLRNVCDVAISNYSHLENLSGGFIRSFQRKFFRGYIEDSLACLVQEPEPRKQFFSHMKGEEAARAGRPGPDPFAQMLLHDIDEEIKRRKIGDKLTDQEKEQVDESLDMFEIELEDDGDE